MTVQKVVVGSILLYLCESIAPAWKDGGGKRTRQTADEILR